MGTNEPLLRLEHVSYRYEDSEPALDDVTLLIGRGERIAVLGNNGAGKSTFFLVCNGILKPQAGSLFFEGHEVKGKKDELIELRKNIGVVFQDAENQIIASTVESEVSFGPMNLRLERAEVERRVEASLVRMDLLGLRGRAPQYLSGGEKKRVSIADILAMEPAAILLDEPTASLDPQNVLLLERTLEQLSAAGITLVVSTHDVDFSYRFAERGIVFSEGKIIADGRLGEIFSDDETIARAGLKKPLIYEISVMVEQKLNKKFQFGPPKNIEEFKTGLSGFDL